MLFNNWVDDMLSDKQSTCRKNGRCLTSATSVTPMAPVTVSRYNLKRKVKAKHSHQIKHSFSSLDNLHLFHQQSNKGCIKYSY